MNSAIRSSFAHPFLEEAQQLPLVRYRGGDDQPVDAGGAEAAADLGVPGFGAAVHARAPEAGESRLPPRGAGHARGEVALAPAPRAEAHGAGDVDGHDHGEVALLDELLHVRHTAARRDVPVDDADVVARLILAHLRELDAATMEGGVVVAGES